MKPNQAQANKLMQFAGAKRFVYNWALAKRRDHYEATKKTLSYKEISAALTQLKKQEDTCWLKDAHAQSLQQALRDMDTAYKNFFAKRAKFPRFKSKRDNIQSFRVPQRVKIKDKQVYVPKVGWVKLYHSQEIDGTTKSATFKRDALGHWYVSLVVEFTMPDVPLSPANPENVVGIDLGLKDFCTLSNGIKEEATKFYRKTERRLAKAQKALSRKKKGSKNREKARLRVTKLHAKVRNQRQDALHKLTHHLATTYEGFCIEDLSVKGLARTKLAKSINDAAFGEFRRQLEYKALWYRKHLAVIDRFFPSSKQCSACGAINKDLTLSDRTWTCSCGKTHDRDYNAATNIKNEGLKQIPLLLAA